VKTPLPQLQSKPKRSQAPGATTRSHPASLRWLFVLVALGVVANLLFMLALRRLDVQLLVPREEQSTQLIFALPFHAGQILAGTVDNRLLLLAEGQTVREVSFETPVGGAAVLAGKDTIAVGTSDGVVTFFDAQLQPLRTLTVGRRIIRLQPDDDNGLFVASGIGAFSDRFFVEYFPAGADAPAWSTRVEYTISDMQRSGDTIIYSTANARVGAIDREGRKLWVVTLRRSPIALLSLQNSDLLVGDERGNVVRLSSTGEVRWTRELTPVPINSLYAAPDGHLLFAGDSRGNLFVLDEQGALQLKQSVASTSLAGFVPSDEDRALVVPRTGPWSMLTPNAVTQRVLAGQVRLAWYGFNGLLVLTLLVGTTLASERRRSHLRVFGKRVHRNLGIYLFVAPSLAFIVLFSYYPAAMAFFYSFTNFSLNRVYRFEGLENYRRIMFDDWYFWVGFGNMLIILITGIVKSLAVPLLVAELVFWLRRESHRYFFRTLFILPAVVPGLVGILMWRMVYDPVSGLLNQLLGAVGLETWQRAWLGDPRTALWAVIGAGFPWISALPFLIYLGGLLNINQEIYDAAQIDGVGWWKRFWLIDLPLLKPQTGLLLFFTFVGSVQGFGGIYIFTGGGPGNATYVPALQMFKQVTAGQFGYASAIGVILFAIIIVATVINMRFRRQTESM
jgi:ABC-type sugar transport system permease subunit